MTDFPEEHDNDQQEDEVSKSQVKREMRAYQELGRRLTELKPHQLDKLDLTDELRKALEEAHRHTARGALKRHLSFVGKLMQVQDVETIQAYVDRLDSSSQAHAEFFHQMERWRDRLLTGKPEEQQAFMEAYPDAERQTIRQLVRQAMKEAAEDKPPAASRKLFKLIREVVENAA
ncbi:ribosome-associated protein [Halopseudomonas litoralis]|uniref:Dual-action ribosomal maturation protein DarP n=1 Tax=Halopseudomonas litoralis TaxID=797277 RepID=A0A1H1LJM3_9GAMM|nr:ribosome biogenesis factor YjgA [Halopseudomonas litoralis]SDR74718.1 ribosome-associated protein [Halopseudomonas litoralis]